MPWSRVNAKYTIHWVLHTLRTASSQDWLSHTPSQFLGRPCCTQFPMFPHLGVNQWTESQLPSRLPSQLLPPDWPPPSTPPTSLDYDVQLHLPSRSITAYQWISNVVRLRTPSLQDHCLQVNLQSCSITTSKCVSELAQFQPPSSHDHSPRVHLNTPLITASKYIFKEQRPVHWATGVIDVDRVTGSIYSADPGVYRHHLISILSYHTMIIHTLCFPSFGLTRSVRDFVHPGNCVDPQRRVVSYLLTRLLHSSNCCMILTVLCFSWPDVNTLRQ